MSAQQADGLLDFARRNLAANFIWRSRLALVVDGNLNAFTNIREAVEISPGFVFPNEDRESFRREPFRMICWIEPEKDLTFHAQRQVQARSHRTEPGAKRQQQFAS